MHHEYVQCVAGDLLSLDPNDLTDAMGRINDKITGCERSLFQSHIHLSRSIRFSRSPNRGSTTARDSTNSAGDRQNTLKGRLKASRSRRWGRKAGNWRGRAVSGRGVGPSLGPARISAEKLIVFVRRILPFIGVSGIGLFARNIGPGHGIFSVKFQPAFGRRLAIWNDCLDRAFRLTYSTIDAFIGVNNQHVLTLVEAVNGADLHTIHIFAADARFCDDIGHDGWIFLLSFGSFLPLGGVISPGRPLLSVS